jgi:serine protease Do
MTKKMTEIIRESRQSIIQIATPYYTGTGFVVNGYPFLVTNEHVVTGNQKVIVRGTNDIPYLAEVVYIDQVNDLALLKKPQAIECSGIHFPERFFNLEAGMTVIAMGHPFGLPFSATTGIISHVGDQKSSLYYIQHDAALNPGNSGGPLLDEEGNVIGINSFTIQDGQNIGFALPSEVLKNILDECYKLDNLKSTRCSYCKNLIPETEENIARDTCPACGGHINFISSTPKYEPQGVDRYIEDVIRSMGYEIELTRKGPSHWMLIKGSALIEISYHEKTGLISAEAYLCRIPGENLASMYMFLLNQNDEFGALTFSIKDEFVLLSFLVYDQYLQGDLFLKYLDNLLQKADIADQILISRYGALPVLA